MTESERSNSRPFQPPLLGLELTPTIAMRNGKQLVHQCANCGLIAIQTDLAAGSLAACPACDREACWWRQEIPKRGSRDSLAGMRS